MTPEQKQLRIEQINAAQVKRRESLAFHQSEYPGLPSPDYIDEIDFLLSLVKSQEAVGGYSELAHEIISEYNSADSPSSLRQGVAQGLARVAASMRSACIEKLREKIADLSRTSIAAEQNAVELRTLHALHNELESLSIEKSSP